MFTIECKAKCTYTESVTSDAQSAVSHIFEKTKSKALDLANKAFDDLYGDDKLDIVNEYFTFEVVEEL